MHDAVDICNLINRLETAQESEPIRISTTAVEESIAEIGSQIALRTVDHFTSPKKFQANCGRNVWHRRRVLTSDNTPASALSDTTTADGNDDC
jgi:hypothetical protein